MPRPQGILAGVEPEDLTDAAAFVHETLETELEADWNAPAGSLEW